MDTIFQFLFIISNGLLIPVVVLLLLLFVLSIADMAGFFGEYNRVVKAHKAVTPLLDGMTADSADSVVGKISDCAVAEFADAVKSIAEHRNNEAFCERVIANFEVDVQKRLGKSRMFIRFGPMLGLMGTLIPMGPALVGLSSGDIASMAYNMQMAFATTVIGMLVAGVGVVTLQFRRSTSAREINDLEYIYRTLAKK